MIRTLTLILFRLLLPSVTILLLIVMPIFFARPTFQPIILDWGIRVLLSIFFCAGYWLLPSVPENGGILWSIAKPNMKPFGENDGLEVFFYVWNALGFSVGMAIVTYWALSNFTPIGGVFRFIVATINGLLFAIFMLSGYSTFRSKIKNNASK